VDGQCDKLVMVVGHHFITLTVVICVQPDGHEALRRAGLSAAAETCFITRCDLHVYAISIYLYKLLFYL